MENIILSKWRLVIFLIVSCFALTSYAKDAETYGSIQPTPSPKLRCREKVEPSTTPLPTVIGTVQEEIDQLPAITPSSTLDECAEYVQELDSALTRIATGGLAEIPKGGFEAICTLAGEITSKPERIGNDKILKNVIQILPPLWSSGFWYIPLEDIESQLSTILSDSIGEVKATMKVDPSVYEAAVKATSLIIRFTKDNVALTEDKEEAIKKNEIQELSEGEKYLTYIPQIINTFLCSEGSGMSDQVTVSSVLAYMKTLPSITDHVVDPTAPFPVMVDPSAFMESDLIALKVFLKTLSA